MKKNWLPTVLAATVVTVGLAGCGSGSAGTTGGLQIWEGYSGAEAKAFQHLLNEWNASHPGSKISSLYVDNDDSLPKLLTAVRGGSQPDIAYVYGSWAPNVAQIHQVVNLTKVVQQPSVDWNDFWVGERDVATVKGEVIGIPALVDNLAVVYNKSLFKAAGLQPPSANWTWNQFTADAQKLTIASKKQFGTAYVTPGTEDTVWHWEGLLWEAGGAILNSSNTAAAFDSPAGLKSLETLRTMAVTDHSMYLDPTDSEYANLFNSGKIGMLVTGPWDLSSFPNVQYGVQIMPSYPGSSGGHQTISGPDNWVIFNNGLGQGRGGGEVPALDDGGAAGEVLLPADRRPADPGVGRELAWLPDADGQGAAGRRHVRHEPRERAAGPAAAGDLPADLDGSRQHDRVGAARQEPAAGGAGERRPAGQPDPGQRGELLT